MYSVFQILDKQQEIDKQLIHVLQQIRNSPVTLVMQNVSSYLYSKTPWERNFYTHGYKVSFVVKHTEKYKSHFSVYFYLEKGMFDDYLKWPFSGTFTIKLEDHQLLRKIEFSPSESWSFRPSDADNNLGYGYPEFLPINNPRVSDSLTFIITVVV